MIYDVIITTELGIKQLEIKSLEELKKILEEYQKIYTMVKVKRRDNECSR